MSALPRIPSFNMSAIESCQDLFRAAQSAYAKACGEVWWRGHAVSDWHLVPKVFREDTGYGYEQGIAMRFRARARTRCSACPAHDDLAAWLFLMQHYGLPTRLLDWTESILIATFFAVCERQSEAGAIWALFPFKLNARETGRAVLFGNGSSDPSRLLSQVFSNDPEQLNQAIALHSPEVDIRMMMQQSAFTIHGNGQQLEAHQHAGDFLKKFEIPAGSKALIREELSRLGIRLSMLFPDLDHLSRELAESRFADPDEVGFPMAATGAGPIGVQPPKAAFPKPETTR